MARVKGAFLLILAVALILFGITFINNAFKSIKQKTTEAIDITENVLTPTRDEPLRLEYPTKNIEKGGKADLTISFMNPTATDKYCQLSIYENRPDAPAEKLMQGSWVIYNNNPTSKRSPEQISVWKVVMEDDEEVEQIRLLTMVVCCADNYTEGSDVSCSASIDNGVEFRKDFILKIS